MQQGFEVNLPQARAAKAQQRADALVTKQLEVAKRQAADLSAHQDGNKAFTDNVTIGPVTITLTSLISMGVNLGLLPTKGLTLPLMSFGGSGLVANCIGLAILLRIDWENRQLARGLNA